MPLPLGLAQGRSSGSEIATVSTLPALAGPTEALAIDAAGTVIVGFSWDRSGLLHAPKPNDITRADEAPLERAGTDRQAGRV